MKKLLTIMIVLGMMIILIGNVSALDWDNKLSYSNEDLKVDFRNSVLGIIPTGEIGTAELKSHKSVNEVLEVELGRQVTMYYDFDFLEKYESGLGEVSFIDMKTGKEVEKDWKYVYWQKQTCREVQLKNGTYTQCTGGGWKDYNSREIPKGKIRIGIEVNVERGDWIDGIWEITGKKVKRHAEWTELGSESYSGGGSTGDVTDLTMTLNCNVGHCFHKALGGVRGDGSSASVFRVYINQSGVNLATADLNIDGADSDVEYANFTSGDYSDAIDSGSYTIEFHRISGDIKLQRDPDSSYSGTIFSFTSQPHPAVVGGNVFTIAEVSLASIDETIVQPENNSFLNSGDVGAIVNVTGDGLEADNVTANVYFANNTLAYQSTNTTGGLNEYLFNFSIIEAQNYQINFSGFDNESSTWSSSTNIFSIDLTNPVLSNLSINDSGNIFGYPKNFTMYLNSTDTNIDDCWGSLNGGANQTMNCNLGTDIGIVEEGNHTFFAYGNDSAGNMAIPLSLDFEINYYTHNVTFNSSLDNQVVTPECGFSSFENQSSYEYHFDIHQTADRNVYCYELGYGEFNFTLDESNFTTQNVAVAPATLNLTFSEAVSGSISHDGGGITFSNETNLYYPMGNFSVGYVYVVFNNGTQVYTFYNDLDTSIVEYVQVEEVDLNQEVKVISRGSDIQGAHVVFKRYVNGSTTGTFFSDFTDVNGLAQILIKDTNLYLVEVTKDGYQDYSELHYIPPANTETIIIDLEPSDEDVDTDLDFFTNCVSGEISKATNCTFGFSATEVYDEVLYIYFWNGSFYNASATEKYTSSLTLNNLDNDTTSFPVNVTLYLDGNNVKVWEIEWGEERSIIIDIDADEFKADSGLLIVLYIVITLLGVFFWVIVESIAPGWGLGVYAMWNLMFAINGFSLLYFISAMYFTYKILDIIWGGE